MYVRTNKRKNKDGTVVEYIQLAHNRRHPEKGYSVVEVIHSFGRKDQLDVDGIRRLVNSLCRFLDPEDAFKIQSQGNGDKTMEFVSSRPAGGAILLKALWDRIGIKECLERGLKDRSFTAPIQESLFALVVNRALDPKSKLGVE